MLYDAKTPEEYLEMLEEDWRRDKLLQLRELIMQKGPELKEGIYYKMLGYEDERGYVFCLNAQKNYVSLYVGDAAKVDPSSELLKGINVGKGCLRFKKTLAVEDTRVDEFIEKALNMWRAGEDIDC